LGEKQSSQVGKKLAKRKQARIREDPEEENGFFLALYK